MATFHRVAKSQTGLKRLSTHIHKWKKPIWESYTPYDPNYIILWTKQNYGDSKMTSVCKGLQGRKEKFLQNIFKKIKANQWVKVRKFNSIQTWVAQLVKNPPAMQEIPVWFLNQKVPLEKGQATLSSIIGLPCGSYSKESTWPAFDSWVGKVPWEGNGNPLQYSCLENPMDRGVHGVAKSQTQLKWWSPAQHIQCLGEFFVFFSVH